MGHRWCLPGVRVHQDGDRLEAGCRAVRVTGSDPSTAIYSLLGCDLGTTVALGALDYANFAGRGVRVHQDRGRLEAGGRAGGY
jgi:hypothetical protein